LALDKGAEAAVVGPYLARRLHNDAWRDCSVSIISGGKSNLTYLVRSAAGEVILRRPPLGHILPTAHDVGREYRIMAALWGSTVPVPRMLLFSDAGEPLDAPFFVMERVIGHVCREELPTGYAPDPPARAAIGDGLITVLASLHTLDVNAVGLQNLGRPAGFLQRQLRRWTEQWERSATAPEPTVEKLVEELRRTCPEQRYSSIVHGDYRLDNTILHPATPGSIVAVLDWEMSTLGDPLTDLATLLAYWADADEPTAFTAARMFAPITALPGFPTRRELVERYANLTGLQVDNLNWYLGFAYFKLAVICQGIVARVEHGAMVGDGFDTARSLIRPLAEAGHHAIRYGIG
jgi:aminoglycoside phosphotransferase (APT) family kinase protein